MPVPDFSPGEILTAGAMDSIGLWLVKTQAVPAGGSAFTVTDAFSANYDNYRIVFNNIGGTAGFSAFMTINGSAGATYRWAGRFWGYGLAAGDGSSGGSTTGGFWLGIMGAGLSGVVDLEAPFLATATKQTAQTSGDTYTNAVGGYDTNPASSTAFTVTLSAGTLTAGTVSVYGYKK
jgi:hypothetical protein